MSKHSTRTGLAALATAAAVAATAALAGVPGIYGRPAVADNGGAGPVVKTAAPLPTGPGANPLSVGHMATFVFKPPTALPEATFNDAAGKPVTFAQLKGKVVLVNLWATWCIPCRKELPDLDRLAAELGSDAFTLVAISLDRGAPEKPRKLLEDMKLSRLVLYHDPSARLAFTLKAIGMPVTLLLDREGREIGRLIGPAEWASEDAKRLIRAAIAAAG